jgi:hypothetical protein
VREIIGSSPLLRGGLVDPFQGLKGAVRQRGSSGKEVGLEVIGPLNRVFMAVRQFVHGHVHILGHALHMQAAVAANPDHGMGGQGKDPAPYIKIARDMPKTS